MIGYRFLTPAEEEMTEAAVFYETASIGLGEEFLSDIQRGINRLREYPQSGPILTGDLRISLLSRFPFSLIYSIETNAILVIAIAHQSRRPGYWQDRVS